MLEHAFDGQPVLQQLLEPGAVAVSGVVVLQRSAQCGDALLLEVVVEHGPAQLAMLAPQRFQRFGQAGTAGRRRSDGLGLRLRLGVGHALLLILLEEGGRWSGLGVELPGLDLVQVHLTLDGHPAVVDLAGGRVALQLDLVVLDLAMFRAPRPEVGLGLAATEELFHRVGLGIAQRARLHRVGVDRGQHLAAGQDGVQALDLVGGQNGSQTTFNSQLHRADGQVELYWRGLVDQRGEEGEYVEIQTNRSLFGIFSGIAELDIIGKIARNVNQDIDFCLFLRYYIVYLPECDYLQSGRTHSSSPSGGTGRRARLKIVCRKTCGFESHLGYQK